MLNDEVPKTGREATMGNARPNHSQTAFSSRVDHIGMMIPNMDEGVDWYVDTLGFILQDRWSNSDAGMEWAHLKLGDFTLELVTRPGLEARTPGTAGYHHLAITVSDCVATVAGLEARGVAVITPPAYFDRHDMDWAFVQDRFGNVIEIVSYRNPES